MLFSEIKEHHLIMECTNYFMQKESQFDQAFATAKSKYHERKEAPGLFKKYGHISQLICLVFLTQHVFRSQANLFFLRFPVSLTMHSYRAKPRRQGFRKLLKVFATNSKDKEIRQFDIDRKFRWEDVQTEADAALEAYTAQVSFRRHPLRYLSRSFTQNASTLEALLQFVPDGEFTFLICGALTLVFNVRGAR